MRDAITRTITTLPEQLRRSLTWDQGAEMAQHAQLRIDTGVEVYFCDPHSPWQRGTNENTNGLLRQYFPKGTDLSAHGADDLAAVAAALNSQAAQDPRLENTCRGLRRGATVGAGRCCDDRLSPPWTPRSLWWISPGSGRRALQGHHQRVDAQLGPEVVGHAPADDLARGQVLDRGQVQPALVRRAGS